MKTNLDEKSEKFWNRATKEQASKGRWLRIHDDVEYELEIDDWTIHRPDTKYGKSEALKTVNGKYFGVGALYIQNLLKKYIGLSICFKFIRYDSKPDSSQTWGELTDVRIYDEINQMFIPESEYFIEESVNEKKESQVKK